jgi:hypothetical protein
MTQRVPGCTCHLEQAFGVANRYENDPPYGQQSPPRWQVFDAECEVVCETPNRDYADLICHALNRLDNSPNTRCGACRIHDEAHWDKVDEEALRT